MSRTSTTAQNSRGGAAARTASELRHSPELHDGWERFWFSPEPAESLRIVRIGLGVLAAFYFATHWADVGYWFGGEGLLSTEQLSRLNQSSDAAGAGRWQLTPLYWIESTLGLRFVLGLGIVASLLTAAGIGGWGVVTLAWLILLSVVARAWVIAGLVEIPLVFGLSGLVIAAWGIGTRGAWVGRRWTTGLARRLLEIHISALVAATALTQLASAAWWNGEGALQLVLPQDGPFLELSSLGNSQLATAALTHLLVWLPIAAVPLLWVPRGSRTENPPRLRRMAAGVLIVHAIALGVLSGQLLYEAANAVLLSLFLVPRGPSGPENRE